VHNLVPQCISAAALLACSAAPLAADLNLSGLAATCNNCHGVGGVSAGSSMASLAGQNSAYLEMVMLQWKSGERFSTTMGRLLAGYSDDEIKALAAYYAEKPWTPAVQELDAKIVRRGGFVVDRCSGCHGKTGGETKTEDTPRLDGQWVGHIDLELEKYRDGSLALPNQKMAENAHKLRPRDLPAVSAFFASQSGAKTETQSE
jgi:cytochrome subunit of sulfide dehydrogenase